MTNSLTTTGGEQRIRSVLMRESRQSYPNLWRAVDQDGSVLDILVQNRRDKAAARRFFRRLLKKTGAVPRVIVTDKLRSYGAAHREVMPCVEHRQSTQRQSSIT